MYWKIIRKDRLNQYRNKVCQLNFLKEKKNEILNRYGLQAYDYSKIKVMSGNGRRMTEQERAAINVERYNKKINELEAEITPERKELATQITRVDSASNNWRHAEALRSYYLEGASKAEAAYSLYGDNDKQNIKNFSEILNTALEILESVSSTPFVQIEQIPLEVWNERV